MSTRERILQTCLALFNADGLAAVSTHRIAAEIGISPGNLHYHFRTKEQIVAWLLRRFEQKIEALDSGASSILAIDDFWLALHLRFETIAEYRFIYRDMMVITQQYPELGERVQAMTAATLISAQALFEHLGAAGVVQAGAAQSRILALQMVFITTCWLSFEQLIPGRDGRDSDPGLAAFYALTLVSPYISDESRAYLEYLKSKYLV